MSATATLLAATEQQSQQTTPPPAGTVQVTPSEQVPPGQIDAAEILLAAAALQATANYLKKTPSSMLVSEGYFVEGGAWEMAGINEWAALVKPLRALVESTLRSLASKIAKVVLSAIFPKWSSSKADQKADQVGQRAADQAINSMAKQVFYSADDGEITEAAADRIAIATVTEVINRATIETLEGVQAVRDETTRAVVPADPDEQGSEIVVDKTWRTRRDSRVRPSHGGLEGEQVTYNGSFRTFLGNELRFPGDPKAPIEETANCVPGWTPLVPVGILQRIYRTWWDGELVTVTLASGAVLSGTPNHPVLSKRGWVGASHLNPGDYLVKVNTNASRDVNIKQEQPTIEDLFNSSRGESGASVERVLSRAFDFHGDKPVDDQVDVVTFNNALLVDGVSSVTEVTSEFYLSPPNLPEPGLGLALLPFSGSSPVQQKLSRSSSADGGVSSMSGQVPLPGSESVSVGLAPEVHPSLTQPIADCLTTASELTGETEHRFPRFVSSDEFFDSRVKISQWSTQPRPEGDTGCDQSPSDSTVGHSVAPSETVDGLSGEVGYDKVVAVDISPWSGHVYTLQTSSGAYTDSLSHVLQLNCRCRLSLSVNVGKPPRRKRSASTLRMT